ncbi:MAG: amino acid ABC transporter permease [Deltaproteobacteria bacterium]
MVFGKRSVITLAVLVLFLASAYYFFVSKGITYSWHWEQIPQMLFYYGTKTASDTVPSLHLGVLMIGFVLTVKISVVAIIFAIILGTIVGICRLSKEPITRAISITFVELIRNTPLLVQIYIIYFFAGSMLRLSAFAAGTAALAIFEGAYVGDPQAFKRIIPPLAGQFISLIKDSSLVSVIALADLMFQGQQAVARTYSAFEIYFTVAALYLIMTSALSMATQYVERRLAVSD